MKRCLLFILIGISCAHAQQSCMQEQSKFYSKYQYASDNQWDSLQTSLTSHVYKPMAKQQYKAAACNLTKRVFGWHPYWNGNLYQNYDWSLLSDFCYFDYTVDPNTGNNSNGSFQWASSVAVTAAQNNGVNISFCVTLFSSHATFFGNAAAKQTLISNIISLLQQRNAKTVNIDFEGVPASQSVNLTAFLTSLSNQLHAAIPGSELTLALYAVDWNGVFDIATLNNSVDLFIIMGYDYYWSGSTQAGPCDPLYNFQANYNYTLSKSITYYLKNGAAPSKLLLGLPYYGREWETVSNAIPSNTTGNFTATRTYTTIRNNANGYYGNPQWDLASSTPYYAFQVAGNWRECFVNDYKSMCDRYDVVNIRGLGGIGIWALGYDDGYSELWNAIRDKFSDCAVVACSDTLYDMGGPSRNYYDNETYTYTISPANAYGLTLNFTTFDTEANFDTLWIFDGASVNAPLLGAYSGQAGPGLVTASGGSLTLRFKSDNLTTKAGWEAIWQCATDNTVPSTSIQVPAGWITQNFNASFTDADAGGSGLDKSFYQVVNYDGNDWRCNSANGFFCDSFNLPAIHPDWTSMSGTWAMNGTYLEQTDQNNTNTNLYAALDQSLSDRYLYSWKGKISGAGNNRRAGFHFMCDDATQSNRGNSYFVWFRVDQSQLQVYKVVNNNFGSPVYQVPLAVTAGQWYDYAVSFDRISGKMDVYMNQVKVGSYTDPVPYTTGPFISFRSGDCNYMVNDVNVYRSRNAAATISVGPAAGNDIRFQSLQPNMVTAAYIRSVASDVAGNLSSVAAAGLMIDWSPPQTIALVSDGANTDLDTTFTGSQLQANWTASADSNSGIAAYRYAIGTTPGDSDLVAWTANGMSTSFTKNGLSLVDNQLYFVSVKALDGAGLVCNSSVSDGIRYVDITGIKQAENLTGCVLQPNPATDISIVQFTLGKSGPLVITLTDNLGQEWKILEKEFAAPGRYACPVNVQELGLKAGVYTVLLKTGSGVKALRLLVAG